MKTNDVVEFLLMEHEEEIIRFLAICTDFKISLNKLFNKKEDKIILDAFKLIISKNMHYSNEIYYQQKVYNEIFKKYGSMYWNFNKVFRKVLFSIKEIYISLGNYFGCDIIKIATQYKDVKK